MNATTNAIRSRLGPHPQGQHARPVRPVTVIAVAVPSTPLLNHALPHVTWSDAYAVSLPVGWPKRDPQEWADAVFRDPPSWVRILFGLRHVAVRVMGIEPGGSHAFDTLGRRPEEILLGTDQRHLSFRASVLVELSRVVVSTVVEVHNGRGRAYSLLVRRIHPWVVRSLLARATRRLAAAP